MSAGLFGWSLPPGVTSSMIDHAYGWDSDERPLIHCSRCGGFLPLEPDRQGAGETWGICTGQPEGYWATYDEDRDAGILAILGDEYAGRRYWVDFDPICGMDRKAHPAHTYTAYAWGINYRRCRRCGFENQEVDG